MIMGLTLLSTVPPHPPHSVMEKVYIKIPLSNIQNSVAGPFVCITLVQTIGFARNVKNLNHPDYFRPGLTIVNFSCKLD